MAISLRDMLPPAARQLARRLLRRPVAVPAPAAVNAGSDATGILSVPCCTMFFSYVRLEAFFDPAAMGFDPAAPVSGHVVLGGAEPPQSVSCAPAGAAWAVTGEALVTPAAFPATARLELRQGTAVRAIAFQALLNLASVNQSHPLFPEFTAAIAAWGDAHGPARPRMLDIGGRARSGIQRSEHFPDCDVTTFDIIADPGVDVVGDAHELSRHFAPESFDFALCIAVFEHLAMPWKVAVEMARVLKPGGMALIFTHQTIGMHDMPWDFFRFSDSAWNALFNRYTGFEIVAARLTNFMHIVPRAWSERHRRAETAGGFEGSAVLIRRAGPPLVDWPVPLPDIIATQYPTA